jgi:hypothetical protein
MNKENPNPIKAAGCTAELFIRHEYSGAPPEILGGGRSSELMVQQLNIPWQEATLIQEKMLAAYDEWEASFLKHNENTSTLSDQFNATYGFTPEALHTAWLDRRREEKWKT